MMHEAVVAVVALAWPASLAAQPAATASLIHAGTVVSSGQPIPGAAISASSGDVRRATTTDETGQYRLELGAGRWKLEVAMVGFRPVVREVEVSANAPAERWSLDLEPRPAIRPQPRREGFERVNLTRADDAVESALTTNADPPDLSSLAANANEAFLLSGSLSVGLQSGVERGAEEYFEMRRAQLGGMEGGRPFGFGGPFEPGAEPGVGGPGGREGFPGAGGPEAGGRGGPGGGVGAGPGGFGGPGGPGGPPGGFGGRGQGGPGGGPGVRGGATTRGGSADRSSGRQAAGGRSASGRSPVLARGREGFFGNRAGRGQQSLRGALTFSFSNSALDARPYSLTGQTVPKASYAQNRFSGMIGGPLMIPKLYRSDKTFLFLNFSGSLGRNPFQATSTLPTQAERDGDFSGRFGSTARIYDPLSGAPFPENRIPANRIDPAARGLLQFFPLPNQQGTVQNYQYVTSVGNDSHQLGVRLNHNLSAKDRFDINTNFQWREATSAQLLGFRDSTDGLGASASLGWTHNFRRSLIHTVRVNFSRNRSETLPFFAHGTDVAATLGIRGVSRDPVNFGPPNLSFTNFVDLSDASALLRRDRTMSVNESLLWVRGKHNLSFGGEYRRMQLNNRTDQNARGTMNFTGLATSAFNSQNQPVPATGFDFADFLLGRPQSSSIRFGGTSTYFRGGAVSLFAQDDWRLRGNLTLNLGVRYEYFQPFHEKYDHIANLDLAPELNAVAVVTPGQSGPFTGVFPRALIDPDPNNISPRTALAWRPLAKKPLQVRASYGLFHNGAIYNQFPSRLAAQPPFASTATVNTSLSRTLTLSDAFATAPSQSITNSYAVDRNYRVSYAQSWSLSVQQPLRGSLNLEIGYLGTKGTRLDIQRLPNRAPAGSPLTAEQRRQIGNATGFTWDSSDGNSIYHAGQVRLTRRFSRGVSANVLYVYSKSIDNASTLGGAGATVAQNDKDLRAERGRSSFDRRHTLSVSYLLTSPVRESSALFANSRWATTLLREWTLSGGLTASSGTPLTARVLGNQSDSGGTGSIGSGRADSTGLPLYDGSRFFNLLAFALPLPGMFGNSSRNLIDGPGRVSLNASFGRSFRIAERRNLEFRVESQNVTNRVNFTNLGTVINAINYGLPTATGRMRTVSATLRLRF